jgi:hypothetical protein
VDFLGATFDDAFELGPIRVGVIRVKNFLPITTFISLVITTTTITLLLNTPNTKCRRSSISYCTYVCAVKFMLLMLFPCVPLVESRCCLGNQTQQQLRGPQLWKEQVSSKQST